MASSDDKTPAPAASRRPRLLGTETDDASDQGFSRSMLASLETDGGPPGGGASARRTHRKSGALPWIAAVVFAGGAAVLGYRSFDAAPQPVASTAPARPASTSPAGGASPATADTSTSGLAAASMPAQIEVAAVAPKPAEPAVSPSASEPASGPSAAKNPLDKLARVDPETERPGSAPAKDSKPPHPGAATARPSSRTVAAAAKAGHVEAKAPAVRKARTGDEDADTELVAAMIARLDRRGAKPLSPALERAAAAGEPGLAARVRDCESKSDLLDVRRCRNRVCDKHWGKAEACPASRAPKPLIGETVDHGEPG